MDAAVDISKNAITLRKGRPTYSFSSYGLIIGQAELFSFDMTTNLGEGKLLI